MFSAAARSCGWGLKLIRLASHESFRGAGSQLARPLIEQSCRSFLQAQRRWLSARTLDTLEVKKVCARACETESPAKIFKLLRLLSQHVTDSHGRTIHARAMLCSCGEMPSVLRHFLDRSVPCSTVVKRWKAASTASLWFSVVARLNVWAKC